MSKSRDLGLHPLVQQQANFVDHHQLTGIGDRDRELVAVLLQGNKVVAEHQVHRNRTKEFVLDMVVFEVHELTAVAPGQIARARLGIRIGRSTNKDCCIRHRTYAPPACAPREKIGRYRAISTVATTNPITIKITGSMSDNAALNAV